VIGVERMAEAEGVGGDGDADAEELRVLGEDQRR